MKFHSILVFLWSATLQSYNQDICQWEIPSMCQEYVWQLRNRTLKIDQDIDILNWENFYQMSETFYQEGKINSYKKIIEDDLRSS